MPSERLRKLELDANNAFDQYRDMYFEGGVSSVYFWDLEHGFAGNICVCRRRSVWFTRCPRVRCHFDQENRRRKQEDQGLLGLHTRRRSPGEEFREDVSLQDDVDGDAVAADEQAGIGDDELGGELDETGTSLNDSFTEFLVGRVCCQTSTSFVSKTAGSFVTCTRGSSS